MANDVKFEGKERRMAKIEKCLAEYGLASLEDARDLCLSKGIDVDKIVKGVQPIAFENASLILLHANDLLFSRLSIHNSFVSSPFRPRLIV